MKIILNKIKSFFRKIVKLFGLLLIVICFIAFLPYIFAKIYDFPIVKHFAGNKLYNPYIDTISTWYKANFHAHSQSWAGVTNGQNSIDFLYEKYDSLEYDLIGISNYQMISRPPLNRDLFIPVYEHGFNIFKRHQLPINAREVVWTDYIFFQTIHHKQDIIKSLKETADLVTLAHPEFMQSYDLSDFTKLTDYDYIEVLNHFRTSLAHWDTALSSGRLCWGMGDDDSHDQSRKDETGRFWTMIAANSKYRSDLVQGLKSGRSYCVSGNEGVLGSKLISLTNTDSTITVKFDSIQDTIRFIGQQGKETKLITKAKQASYTFLESDTYIRVEAYTSKNKIYLNPVIRVSELPFLKELSKENTLWTWIYRIIVIFIYLLLIFSAYKIIVKRKKRAKNHIGITPVLPAEEVILLEDEDYQILPEDNVDDTIPKDEQST